MGLSPEADHHGGKAGHLDHQWLQSLSMIGTRISGKAGWSLQGVKDLCIYLLVWRFQKILLRASKQFFLLNMMIVVDFSSCSIVYKGFT